METLLKCAMLLVLSVSVGAYDVQQKCFHSLSFGVATAAYQIEGAWNVSGKSASIWDTYVHRYPGRVFDHKTGDVAADSYHHYKDDVKLLKDLRVQFYRFSIAWSRILPTGFSNSINQDGVRYYSNLIDELLANDIQPLVTMYHWDLPQSLQDMGGWTNPITADYFVDYARVLFTIYGSRVQAWLTFNEPLSFCHGGYGGLDAPGAQSSGLEEYMCTHNVLRAHGMVYRLYERKFKNLYNGLIGITLDLSWLEPNTTSAADQKAAEVARQFTFGWFAHPIFSAAGDYPPIMRSRIDSISLKQNYSRSRLPKFTDEEVEMIRGSAHFLGLNHYTTYLISPNPNKPGSTPSFGEDMGVIYSQKSEWPKSNSTWLKVVPWGLRKALNWVKHEYKNPMVIITENGVSMEAGLKDPRRVSYIDGYLRSLHDAIYKDSCAVFGYTYWSLMDNFEWLRGYSEKFGLYQVDFNSPNRTRTPRRSASYFADVVATGCLPDYTHYNIDD